MIQVESLPEDQEQIAPRNGVAILAEGETTHHCHYLTVEEAIQFKPSDRIRRIAEEFGIQDTRSILSGLRITTNGATLWHGTPTSDPNGPCDPDHNAIALPIGDYLVISPREFDGSDDFKRVAD